MRVALYYVTSSVEAIYEKTDLRLEIIYLGNNQECNFREQCREALKTIFYKLLGNFSFNNMLCKCAVCICH